MQSNSIQYSPNLPPTPSSFVLNERAEPCNPVERILSPSLPSTDRPRPRSARLGCSGPAAAAAAQYNCLFSRFPNPSPVGRYHAQLYDLFAQCKSRRPPRWLGCLAAIIYYLSMDRIEMASCFVNNGRVHSLKP